MKFEYQVKPFSAGQPPDQIEKVLNQSQANQDGKSWQPS